LPPKQEWFAMLIFVGHLIQRKHTYVLLLLFLKRGAG
jgi:hypothetical protein